MSDLVRRVAYEDVTHVTLHTGMRLKRHLWALKLERLACWVRGEHRLWWEPDWREWYCNNCGERRTFRDLPPPENFEELAERD